MGHSVGTLKVTNAQEFVAKYGHNQDGKWSLDANPLTKPVDISPSAVNDYNMLPFIEQSKVSGMVASPSQRALMAAVFPKAHHSQPSTLKRGSRSVGPNSVPAELRPYVGTGRPVVVHVRIPAAGRKVTIAGKIKSIERVGAGWAVTFDSDSASADAARLDMIKRVAGSDGSEKYLEMLGRYSGMSWETASGSGMLVIKSLDDITVDQNYMERQ